MTDTRTKAQTVALFEEGREQADRAMADRLAEAMHDGRITPEEEERAQSIIRRVPAFLNWRLTVKAGWADTRLGSARIAISGPILQDNGPIVMERTYPHEVAHVVADQLHGRRCSHGRAWRYWCSILQGVPFPEVSATHDYDVRRKDHRFKCTACNREYRCGPVQAKRIAQGNSGYRYSSRCCAVTLTKDHLL